MANEKHKTSTAAAEWLRARGVTQNKGGRWTLTIFFEAMGITPDNARMKFPLPHGFTKHKIDAIWLSNSRMGRPLMEYNQKVINMTAEAAAHGFVLRPDEEGDFRFIPTHDQVDSDLLRAAAKAVKQYANGTFGMPNKKKRKEKEALAKNAAPTINEAVLVERVAELEDKFSRQRAANVNTALQRERIDSLENQVKALEADKGALEDKVADLEEWRARITKALGDILPEELR